MSAALAEILDLGMRAWAKGITFQFRGVPYAIYFVKYKSTIHENRGGRWN